MMFPLYMYKLHMHLAYIYLLTLTTPKPINWLYSDIPMTQKEL